MRRWPLLLIVLLAACGGAPPSPPGVREAETALRLARADFARHRYAQAAGGYERALEAAWRLDDPALIGAAGSELALTELRAGDAEAALGTARAVDAELDRRGAAVPVLAVLAAAAAAINLERLELASAVLDGIDEAALQDPLVAGRVAYLRGRIAAARGDATALVAHIAALPENTPAALATDRAELEARLLSLRGDDEAALARFLDVAEARRELDQLEALGDALALAAEAAAGAGDNLRAADAYLRAARNAWLVERPRLARTRLEAARRAARDLDDPMLEAGLSALAARLEEEGV